MGDNFLRELGLDRDESGEDVVVPFTLEKYSARGRIVRFGKQLDNILRRHNYPNPVARLLGEALTLASLIGSSLKFEGRFILQLQTDGAVNLIVVDFNAPNGLRGCARYDHKKLLKLTEKGKIKPKELLGKGHLAMTIDQGINSENYQGLVEIDNIGFEEIAERYFMQSEQIPTKVRLAVGEEQIRGESHPYWRSGGILLQYLPDGEKITQIPSVPVANKQENDEGWLTAKAHLATLDDAELLDCAISPERLLFRLFHEGGLRIFTPQHIEERCTCSAERIEDMLANKFSEKDREAMIKNGQIEVACEFCSSKYYFNPNQFLNIDK